MNKTDYQTRTMEFIVERFKELFWVVITALGSILLPVKDILLLLSLGFLFNIITGIVADIHVNKAEFNFKKAFSAIIELTFFSACVLFIHHGCKLMAEPDMGAIAVKWLMFIVSYFYITNIFKNAKKIFPRNEAIAFIYEILSTEIFIRLKSMITGYRSNQINDK